MTDDFHKEIYERCEKVAQAKAANMHPPGLDRDYAAEMYTRIEYKRCITPPLARCRVCGK
jgi:hypothetical protein